MPERKRRQKGLRVSNFALLLVVFKWHHGSEGVKARGGERGDGKGRQLGPLPDQYEDRNMKPDTFPFSY